MAQLHVVDDIHALAIFAQFYALENSLTRSKLRALTPTALDF
jgi:hypothetical protein